MNSEIRKVPERNRYEILFDDRVAGFLEYEPHDDHVLAFTHTVVDSSLRGQGLAGRLVTVALDEAREDGKSVLPYCSYVQAFIGKHPEYNDLVPASRHAEFGM